MKAALDSPVQPPGLSDARLAQMRAHLLAEVERDARKRAQRGRVRPHTIGRRSVLALVAGVLAVIYSVPAVAEERWWWASSPDDSTAPVTQVVTVGHWKTEQLMLPSTEGGVPTAHVATGGEDWTVQVYVSKDDQLCIGISPDPRRPANEGAGIGCGFPVHGLAPSNTKGELHWVGFVAGIPGKVTSNAPKFMFGPAAANVANVDLENNDGRVIRVPTQSVPKGLGIRARFWIVVLPTNHLVHTIVPRDEDGKALEHWRLLIAQ
jgi:hypothetical protein